NGANVKPYSSVSSTPDSNHDSDSCPAEAQARATATVGKTLAASAPMAPRRKSAAAKPNIDDPVIRAAIEAASRPFVRIVIELADDRGDALLARHEVVPPVAVAPELAVLAQRVERAGDLAAVLAAERLDHVGVEHRAGGERLLDRLEARRPGEHLGGAARVVDLALAPERPRAVEADLGPRFPSVERGIHGLALHALQHDEILVRLEARAERPFGLAVVVEV